MSKDKPPIVAEAAVFYADGSSKPNPGRTTFGVHGYSYVYSSDKSPTFKYDFTHLGYKVKSAAGLDDDGQISLVRQDDDALEEIQATKRRDDSKPMSQTLQEHNVLGKAADPVYPVKVYDIYGYVSEHSNNNIAELEAAKSAIECAVKNGYKKIDIVTDSISTVQCYNAWIHKWADNGWRKSDGTPLKALEYMQNLHKYLCDVTSQGYSYKLHWIEGHSGHYGNERADMNAEHAHNQRHTSVVQRDSQSHFNYKSKRPSQLYLPSLIGTLNNKRTDGLYAYISTNREDKIQLYGTKSTTAAYSIILSKTPIDEIQALYKGCQKFGVDEAKYVLVDLQKLYSRQAALDMEDLKENAFIKNDAKSFIVGTAHCYDIAVQLDTPMMTHNVIRICEDSINTAYDAVDNKLDNPNIKCHDVTDQLFTKNAKGKTEVVKHFIHTDKSFSLEINLFGQTTKEDFVPGQCFASRSVLKELEGKNAKMYLVVKEVPQARSWNYVFLLRTDTYDMVTIAGYATTRIKLTDEQKLKIKSNRKK